MKTFILTYILAEGNPINIVVSSTGRNKAFKKAEPLFWELSAQSGFRCIERKFKCLG
jgi:hypothetical protein